MKALLLIVVMLGLTACNTPARIGLPDSDTVEAGHAAALTLADLPPVGDFQLTLSFGVVQRFDEEQQTGLLARADQALYRSKTAGKNFISG